MSRRFGSIYWVLAPGLVLFGTIATYLYIWLPQHHGTTVSQALSASNVWGQVGLPASAAGWAVTTGLAAIAAVLSRRSLRTAVRAVFVSFLFLAVVAFGALFAGHFASVVLVTDNRAGSWALFPLVMVILLVSTLAAFALSLWMALRRALSRPAA